MIFHQKVIVEIFDRYQFKCESIFIFVVIYILNTAQTLNFQLVIFIFIQYAFVCRKKATQKAL